MAGERRTALVLGGSGLVGYQVARKLVEQDAADALVISALTRAEAQEAAASLRREFPDIPVRAYHGDLFLPGEPGDADADAPPRERPDRRDPELRRRLFEDLYRDFESAYRDSFLARLVALTRPTVVVDCVNTATGISYQDVFTAGQSVRASIDSGDADRLGEDVEGLLVSLSIPQLILHSRILNRALVEAETRLYLKIGTTGTGGMGLNIPYTHGEERPSPQLLNKTAVAFAQTGMLFLMGRTPGGPIIKEVKPAALIGYRGVEFRHPTGRQFHLREREGKREFALGGSPEPYTLYHPREVNLGDTLDLTPDPAGYEVVPGPDGSGKLQVPIVDTGENGLFTRGEFEAITALDQMEYITPEEIAEIAVMEVRGGGTGKDVITAVDSAVLGSTYKAGLLRPAALEVLRRLEEEHGVPSVALGRLGPPDLAKHLFEVHLFEKVYGSLDRILDEAERDGAAPRMSEALAAYLEGEPLLASMIVSIGIPILRPDGKSLLRGPAISSPPYRSFRTEVSVAGEALEEYVGTWVDLRPERMAWWIETFREMNRSKYGREAGTWSTARVDRRTYLADDLEIGNVVAWIFSNQGQGFRVL